MKIKYAINFLFLFNLLNIYATNGISNRNPIKEKIINVFDMVLTPTPETCTGNGQITIDITNTENGAEFEFTIYNSSNLVTPVRVESTTATGVTLQYTVSSLPSNSYHVIAIQTVGANTNQQSGDVTITDNIEPLDYTLSQEILCTGVDIMVNITTGNPAKYQLYNSSNTLVAESETSNIFSSVVAGDYTVIVTDVCSNSLSLGVTVVDDPANYGFMRGGNQGFYVMEDCNTIRHIERLSYNGTNNIPAARFPIDVLIEIQNPFGGPNTIINSTWNSNADNAQLVLVPFYDGQAYDYTVTITDNCGKVVTTTDLIRAIPQLRLRELVANCGSKYISIDRFYNYFAPVQMTFTNYPVGFDPANYNADFTAGTYTHTYNTNPINLTEFGSPSLGVPEGDYTLEITSCGRTQVRNFTVTNSVNYSIRTFRNYSGCGDNEGSVNLYIRANTGSQADNFVSVNVTSAPAEFVSNYGALPYDVSYNIAANGQFYMNSLPAGDYTVEGTGECGVPVTAVNFTIYDKSVTSTVTPTLNCGSFNVTATISSYLGSEIMWLQKYYPESGKWGHPSTGILYIETNNINSNVALQINTTNNTTGYQTFSGTLNNITETGQFRVVVQSIVHGNGGTPSQTCRELLDTFNVPTNGISLNNYYVANCTSGNTELVIDAIGVAPLNYTITEFNGSPLAINNGTNPIFSELTAGEYTVEIEDGCGNVSVFKFKTDVVKSPVIRPKNLCNGQIGSLFVTGLSFLNIEWTKGNDPTVIATGNTLTFNTFNEATDTGIYHATLSYTPNPNACIAQTLDFEVLAPQPVPEAGTGQVTYILQQNTGLINLFDLLTPPYDNYGDWVDLSNTGALNNEILDAGLLPVGMYEFEYTVSGTCSGSDRTTVLVNILATDLTANTDEIIDICPIIEQINIGNVMNNDTENSTAINPSNYTITVETPDTEGIISVNPDGSVDVAAGAQPGQVYTLEYRITETANPNNFAIGTLNVTITTDTTNPTFVETLPIDVTVECDAIPTAETLTATDNCGTAVVTFEETRTDGTCASNFVLTRTWTAKDLSGNQTIHTQTITVQDTTNPTFDTVPPTNSITVECAEDIPTATVITATDNCGIATVYVDEVRTDGACFGQFTIERRWIAIDECGNQVISDPQIITVNDVNAPTFNETLPTDLTLECTDPIPAAAILTATDCTYDIAKDIDGNFRLDGSLLLNIQAAMNGYDTNNGDPYGVVGTWLVNDYLYTYASGTQSPAIPNPLPEYNGVTFTITTTNLSTSSEPSSVTPNGFGNGVNLMNARIQIEFSSDVFFTINGNPNARAQEYVEFSGDGTILVPYPNGIGTHSDSNLISSITEPYYLYNPNPFDPSNPNLNRANTTRSIYGGIGTQLIVEQTHPTGGDNLPLFELQLFPQQNLVTFNETTTTDSCSNNYTLTREWTATDDCGNTTSHVQTITVQDTTSPTFVETLPTDVTVECDAIPTAETLTATDNCGTAVVTFEETRTDGTCASNYVLTRTWTATDACNNQTAHTQTITVQDTTNPTFVETLPTDVTVECDAIPTAETLTATDNCGTAAVTFEETRTDGTCTSNFVLTRTWTATDACNNQTVHTQTITVQDTTNPTFVEVLPSDLELECTATIPVAETLTATDNCGTAVVIFEETRTDGTCASNYVLTRTWTATDACNNQTAHTQTITVQDTTPPVFTGNLPVDAYVACDNIPEAIELTATDNCGNVSIAFDEERIEGDCSSRYQLIRTWTATDDCGNESEHVQTLSLSCEIEVFNAVTPNGDGKNDIFLLQGIDCYPNNMVEIYNRWGIKVFETNNYDNVSNVFRGISDGRSTISRNELLPTGTYYYILKYEFSIDGENGKQNIEKAGYLYIQNK